MACVQFVGGVLCIALKMRVSVCCCIHPSSSELGRFLQRCAADRSLSPVFAIDLHPQTLQRLHNAELIAHLLCRRSCNAARDHPQIANREAIRRDLHTGEERICKSSNADIVVLGHLLIAPFKCPQGFSFRRSVCQAWMVVLCICCRSVPP